MPTVVMPSLISSLSLPIPTALEVFSPTPLLFILLLIMGLAVGAYFWMQRRERIIQAYAQEEARMRSSIPEMQARIDQEVDLEVAAASGATGSSFAATAAALPRASEAALNEPPPAPRISLPGCGPVPGLPTSGGSRASFAASAARRSVLSHGSSEYTLGDDRPSVMSRPSRTEQPSYQAAGNPASEPKRASTQRQSMAALAESRKSLVEVMKMYGPEEEKVEVKVSRTSLSGWYAEEKKESDEAERKSLSTWYGDGASQSAAPDPSKVVSLEQGKEGDVSVPSTVARDLTSD
ncbi:unnamed protein product [Durusdinium trenchii]|uniref:Uncharacterized protein n=2 Tax=Durusdinium trenchii TaxID=1381693 RepID=A0ABP0QPF9_9DINO